MLFKEGTPLYATELERRHGEDVLFVNYIGAPFVPSIADNPSVMAGTVDSLLENPGVSRIVFVQQRNYNYPFEQVSLLSEIARLHTFFMKQENILSPMKLDLFGSIEEIHNELSYFLGLLKQDPVSCYLDLKRRIRELRGYIDSGQTMDKQRALNYVRFLERFRGLLEASRLIKSVISLPGLEFGERRVYKYIFRPEILPNFSFTRLVARIPEDADLIDQYEVEDDLGKIPVTILKKQGDPKYFYHILPPEYSLNEEHHNLVNLARNVLIEHR